LILDADVLIDLLREFPAAESWLSSLSTIPSISGMAALEVLYGATNASHLRKVDRYLKQFPILWPSEADARTARRLAAHHLSDGIELIDVMTAAIALLQYKALSRHSRSVDRTALPSLDRRQHA
jgi:predicted nucleic acid-binding protein